MKRQAIMILTFLSLIGCSNIDYKPKYADFENDWERENLIGKVKSVVQYKAYVTDFETVKTGTPAIEFKKEFNQSGNVLNEQYFDNHGSISMHYTNSYDKNGFRIESTLTGLPVKSKEKAVFDSITKKKISSHIIYDDTLISDAFYKYDKYGNLLELTEIRNGDTTSSKIDYKYDNDGRIIFSKQKNSENDEPIQELIYDSEGDLLELIYKSEYFGETRTKYEYDSEKLIDKITEYNSGQIESETSFDKFYNKTLVRFYENNALHREMKFEYAFDKTGNWIKREVFLKEYHGNKKSVPIYTETRVIEYYK